MQRPKPGSVGFVFSRITHFLVEGGSSAGTAFPSGHCAITTCAFIMSLIYMRPLGIAYVFVCPGLVFATVWCGFHYVMDAMVVWAWLRTMSIVCKSAADGDVNIE